MNLKIHVLPLNASSLKLFSTFALVLLCSAEASRWLGIDGLPISALWPPSGLLLGAALVLGFPAIVLGGAVFWGWLLLFEGAGAVTALMLAASQLLGPSAAVIYLRIRAGELSVLQANLRQRFLYTQAGILAATLTATLGSAAMIAGSNQPLRFNGYDIFLVYWLLEVLSILLFTPLAYYFLLNPGRFAAALKTDFCSRQIVTWSVLAALLTVLVGVMPALIDRTYAIALAFLYFPLLCWFALTAKPASVLTIIPLFAVVFVAFNLEGMGGLPQLDTINQLVRALLLLTGMILLIQVIAVMNQSRNQLLGTFRQQANTDFLSGLANDRAFSQRIDDVLAEALQNPIPPEEPSGHWLVYLQVLDFDHVEDLMGYRASRNLEAMLAARLMGTCGPQGHPARIGNGIFSLLVEDASGDSLERTLTRLYMAFDGEIFGVEGQQTRVRVAIGAVRIDGSLEDNSQYLSAATQASLMARDRLPRITVVENPRALIEDRLGMTERLELLKNALSDERLVLFAQPIVPIRQNDSQLTYEILIRLKDEHGNFLSPGTFLPIAEAYGFMRQIDQWVIKQTCMTLAANPEWLARTRKCSINLAGISVSSSDILDYITAVIRETRVPAGKLGFEVTETQHIQSRDVAEGVTAGLRRLGCSVSLDDFGTGLASFDYLKTFEFDILKIDGAFVKSITSDDHDRRIVKAICDVARGMGLETVAEFVENQDVVELLGELGVDYGQGFGLGRPQPMADLFVRDAAADIRA